MKDSLDDFDTSYWRPKDPVWLAAREAQWPVIMELLYLRNKSKKALGIIKRYFFKGTLPDWAALKNWEHSERHLDLMLFLYLHPSRDHAVLAPLRDAYLQSAYVVPNDIWLGMINLLYFGSTRSCSGGGAFARAKRSKRRYRICKASCRNSMGIEFRLKLTLKAITNACFVCCSPIRSSRSSPWRIGERCRFPSIAF
ncbi:hypothetical protein [Pseudomonas indica]|uniref:hypothetical protein n=1 Tax=Pseudomonas indica TaxID=137658 RepID=UPI000BAB95EA|nr:hypothetical protein [Pseudomonas indica]PAU65360.1 hypothetical protein BZL42_00370 [Pseudomonas indica]